MDAPEDLQEPATPRRRPTLVRAAIGAVALAGVVVGGGAIVAAQGGGEPAPEAGVEVAEVAEVADDEEWLSFERCMADQLGELWTDPEVFFGDEMPFEDPDLGDVLGDGGGEGFVAGVVPLGGEQQQRFDDAAETCSDLLPDEAKDELEAWRPYEECVDAQVGALAGSPDTFDDAEWEAYDDAWGAADEACRNLLPEDAQAELGAFDAFDECLAELDVMGDGPIVHIETLDGYQAVEFGDVVGSVTVTGDVNGATVTTEGGVKLLDEAALEAGWEALDDAFAECENLLPDDLLIEFGGELADGSFEADAD